MESITTAEMTGNCLKEQLFGQVMDSVNETDRILSEAQRRGVSSVWKAIVFSNENGILGETSVQKNFGNHTRRISERETNRRESSGIFYGAGVGRRSEL